MSTNATLGSNLCKKYWRIAATCKILSTTIQDGVPSMDDAKFLDVIIKPDSYKIKFTPCVAKYISALRERMYELIF